MPARPRIGTVVKVGFSALIIFAILWSVNLSELLNHLKNANQGFLLLGGLCFISVVFFDAVRIFYFFRDRFSGAGKTSWGNILNLCKINLASLTVANIAFGSVGAELYKAAALRSSFGSLMVSIGSIVAVRLIAMIVTLGVTMLSMVSLIWQGKLPSLFTDMATAFFEIEYWVWIVGLCALVLISLVSRVLYKKIDHLLRQALSIVLTRSAGQVVMLFVISAMIEIARLISFVFFARAFGIQLGTTELLFVSTISTLLILLPISWNGLGVREVSVAGLLTLFGVDFTTASSIAIVSRVIMTALSLLGVFFIEAKFRQADTDL